MSKDVAALAAADLFSWQFIKAVKVHMNWIMSSSVDFVVAPTSLGGFFTLSLDEIRDATVLAHLFEKHVLVNTVGINIMMCLHKMSVIICLASQGRSAGPSETSPESLTSKLRLLDFYKNECEKKTIQRMEISFHTD